MQKVIGKSGDEATLGQYDLFILLAGVSALVAQFSTVDQFRWVGWFNMALGIVSLVLLATLFHGEWKSPCMTKAKNEKVLTDPDHKKRCMEFFTKASTLKIIVSKYKTLQYIMCMYTTVRGYMII